MANDTVYAAGAVLWKVVDKELKILVVHRTQHKDVSIPKGKVDSGETLPATAVREIREETGLDIALGPYLGTVDYTLPSNGKRKEVHYWAAEVDPTTAERSPFKANNEIRALEWMTIPIARDRLSYSHDVGLVDALEKMYSLGYARTFPIIIVRHAKAVPRLQLGRPRSAPTAAAPGTPTGKGDCGWDLQFRSADNLHVTRDALYSDDYARVDQVWDSRQGIRQVVAGALDIRRSKRAEGYRPPAGQEQAGRVVFTRTRHSATCRGTRRADRRRKRCRVPAHRVTEYG
jgi:8-oxo-dGTP pyrophosphatase MutT (NUDIX family)